MIPPYWLNEIYDLVQNKDADSALNIIWRQFDKLFREGEFQKANDVLPIIELDRLEPTTIIGVLTVTLAAKEKLPFRSTFVFYAEKILTEYAPGRVESLMSGLR